MLSNPHSTQPHLECNEAHRMYVCLVDCSGYNYTLWAKPAVDIAIIYRAPGNTACPSSLFGSKGDGGVNKGCLLYSVVDQPMERSSEHVSVKHIRSKVLIISYEAFHDTFHEPFMDTSYLSDLNVLLYT